MKMYKLSWAFLIGIIIMLIGAFNKIHILVHISEVLMVIGAFGFIFLARHINQNDKYNGTNLN